VSCESFDKVKQIILRARAMLGEILSDNNHNNRSEPQDIIVPFHTATELMDSETMDLVVTQLELVNPLNKSPFYVLIETSGSNEEHDKKVCGISRMHSLSYSSQPCRNWMYFWNQYFKRILSLMVP